MAAESVKQIVERYEAQLNALTQKIKERYSGIVWNAEPYNLFYLYLDCLLKSEKYLNPKSRKDYFESKKCEFTLQGLFEYFEDSKSCIDKELIALWDCLMEEDGV